MPTYTALINYKHHNGHFSHILTLCAKNAERAARKAAATARNMHRMHGHFILTMWEKDSYLFSCLISACADPENQATHSEKEQTPCRELQEEK